MGKLTAKRVNELFLECLFADDAEYEKTGNPVIAEGIINEACFHPERLKEHEDEIKQLLDELPNEFKQTGGGGWSFLNACHDKDGNHWAEHPTMGQLFQLGIGINYAKWVTPRDQWHFFPGGMPYVVVLDKAA